MCPKMGAKTEKDGVAAVAQLVEQRIRNAWVGGSSPFCGTIFSCSVTIILGHAVKGGSLWGALGSGPIDLLEAARSA